MGPGGPIIPVIAKRKLRLAYGKFMLDENNVERPPRVSVRENDADIGCTTVTREAVEELHRLFEKHYPKFCQSSIEVQ